MTFAYQYLYSVTAKNYSADLFATQASSPPQEVEQFFTGRTVHVPELSSNARWINVPTFLFFPLHILDIVSNMKVLRKKKMIHWNQATLS